MDPKRNKIHTQAHVVYSKEDNANGIEFSVVNDKNKTVNEPRPVRREAGI
jgi:hypothetical protein